MERANERLRAQGAQSIPEGLTPHSLRRTFASILVALGREPAVFQRQMGHATARFTLDVYAAAMVYGEGDRERLQALVEGGPPRFTTVSEATSISCAEKRP